MHCNNLRLVLGLGLVRVSSRVRVRNSVVTVEEFATRSVAVFLLTCHRGGGGGAGGTCQR